MTDLSTTATKAWMGGSCQSLKGSVGAVLGVTAANYFPLSVGGTVMVLSGIELASVLSDNRILGRDSWAQKKRVVSLWRGLQIGAIAMLLVSGLEKLYVRWRQLKQWKLDTFGPAPSGFAASRAWDNQIYWTPEFAAWAPQRLYDEYFISGLLMTVGGLTSAVFSVMALSANPDPCGEKVSLWCGLPVPDSNKQ